MIDPQLQGITWIKEKEKNSGLETTRLTPETMSQAIKILERSVEQGKPVLIENLEIIHKPNKKIVFVQP